MSDSTREWRFYIDDMIGFASKVQGYTNGVDRTAFGEHGAIYDATLRNLELIGKAATRVPAEIRAVHPQIPWRQIIGTRNRLIHGYLGIDDDTLWIIIRDYVPTLLKELIDMRDRYRPTN